MKLPQLKTEFLEHLEIERGRSLKTIENYDHYLSRFLEFAKLTEADEITDEIVRKYRIWLNRQDAGKKRRGADEGISGTLKKKTQNYYLIALRAFLRFFFHLYQI